MPIIAFNTGSATLKFALFGDAAPPSALLRGRIENFGEHAKVFITTANGVESFEAALGDHATGAAFAIAWMNDRLFLREKRDLFVGHRLVHVGGRYSAPVSITDTLLADMARFAPEAPLHASPMLSVVRRVQAELGNGVTTLAIFDNAFFKDMPAFAQEYALPRAIVASHDLRRCGYHGLAHRSMHQQFCEISDLQPEETRVVSFQLGSGCSAAAIAEGKPVDTSMGFTPMEGLVMSTRAGDLDPGLLLYLLRQGMTAEYLDDQLSRASGLAGLSGVDGNMRRLLALELQGHAGAHLAIEVFCHRARKYLGAYLALLGGADAVLFGGGIGERAPDIRARICAGMEWAGLQLDSDANHNPALHNGRISSKQSRLAVFALSVDEEAVMAQEMLDYVDSLPAAHHAAR